MRVVVAAVALALASLCLSSAPPPAPPTPTPTLSPCCAATVIASCFGFSANDSTSFLQSALSCPLATTVKVDLPPGGVWPVQPLLMTRSNVIISIEPGTVLRAVRGAYYPSGSVLLVRFYSFTSVSHTILSLVGDNAPTYLDTDSDRTH